MTQEQIAAVFSEWHKRATSGKWDAPHDSEESARLFAEIAHELFPGQVDAIERGAAEAA